MSEDAGQRRRDRPQEALPHGWETAHLRATIDIEYGKALTSAERNASGEVPVFGSSGIVGYHNESLVDGPCVIIGRKGSSGQVHYSRDPCWPIDTTYYVCPPDGISPLYLYYTLSSLALGDLDKSTTIPSLSRDDFYAQSVPIAPIAEQNRIVNAIDAQFTRIDAAVAALKSAKATLRHYRASVLQAACEGRLVPTEAELARQEGRLYEQADELLERILEARRAKWEEERWDYEIERAKKKAAQAERKAAGLPHYIRDLEPEHWKHRTPEEYEPYLPKGDKWKEKYDEPERPDTDGLSELPEGWCWASVDAVAVDTLIGLVRNRAQQSETRLTGTCPYIKMNNVTMEGRVNTSELVYVAAADPERERFDVSEGDLLFNTRNSLELVGKVGYVQEVHTGMLFNNNLMRIRTASCVDSRFVCNQMVSPGFRERMESAKSSTTNVAAVYARDLLPLPLAIPPLPEQRRIVEDIERRVSVVDVLEQSIDANLARGERLRQAILKKAFEGRLVPQDPDDEPASVLLERITSSRKAAKPQRG